MTMESGGGVLKDFELRETSNEFTISPLWIIGPRSYFSDRIVPLAELSVVPARRVPADSLVLEGQVQPRSTQNFSRLREKIKSPHVSFRAETPPADRYYVDLRPFGLRNWSHCLNNALPAAVKIREHLAALELPAPVFILKDDTFSKVRDLFGALGLEYLCTDRVVNAPLIRIEIAHGPILNQNAREFTAPIADQIDTLVASVPEMSGTKVFLNRKAPQRSLTNADEITALLTERGYQEYFLEDYSAAEQIAIILRASEIVAIHGAALAPVVFRRPEHGPFKFVEIYSPGHVVPVFRDMTEDLPCTYRMVRGVPNPDMASEAYSEVDSPSMNFTNKHSLKPFRLDPVSLQIALDSTESDDFPLGLINQPK